MVCTRACLLLVYITIHAKEYHSTHMYSVPSVSSICYVYLIHTAVEGFEIPHPDFQFKSKREVTQFILTKQQPPEPLEAQIQSAHTPPLHLLSSLWPDGRNGQHLYSNPGFFFEHWRTSIKKETLRRKSTANLLSVS